MDRFSKIFFGKSKLAELKRHLQYPYRLCKRCKNFHTMDCPQSIECFALDSKPMFKSK